MKKKKKRRINRGKATLQIILWTKCLAKPTSLMPSFCWRPMHSALIVCKQTWQQGAISSTKYIYTNISFIWKAIHWYLYRHTVCLYSNRWAKIMGVGSDTETNQQPPGALRCKTPHGKLLQGRGWLCTPQQEQEFGPCGPGRAQGQWIPIKVEKRGMCWGLADKSLATII